MTAFTKTELQAIEQARPIPRLVTIPLGIGSLVCGGHDVFGAHPACTLLVGLFTACMMFCWTSTLHEAAHHTLFKRRWANEWLGRWLGIMMFLPYTVYRESHIRHHAYLNQPGDWELWPYSDPTKSLRFRRTYAWFDLICGIVSSPIIYGRIYFHANSPIRQASIRRTIRYEYVGVAVFWLLVLSLIGLTNSWQVHLKGTFWPMMVAGFLQTGRKFTEHLGMSSFDPLQGTRTVLPSHLLLRFSSFLNFDIFVHGPHHRHPRAAHHTLQTRMGDYVCANPTGSFPVYRNYSRAVWDMLPHLFRNPACGINAGAATTAVSHIDVEDFVGDVVTEVLGSSSADSTPPQQVSSGTLD